MEPDAFENTKGYGAYPGECTCNNCMTEGLVPASPDNPCTVTRWRDSWA